jgi:hypothetical protein
MGCRTSWYNPVDTAARFAGISPKLGPSDILRPMNDQETGQRKDGREYISDAIDMLCRSQ